MKKEIVNSQEDAMRASTDSGLLQVLIDKVVDNGTAIRETQDQIRQLPGPAEVNERIGALEQRLAEMGAGSTAQLSGLGGQVAAMGKDVQELREQVGAPGSRLAIGMNGLSRQLEEYVGFFTHPSRKEIHYRHFLGWPMWTLIGMVLIMSGEGAGLVSIWRTEAAYEQHDLLWRAAKLSEDSVVTKALDELQGHYEINPEQFGKDVASEEDRRAELYERWLQVNERMGKIKQLEQEKKKVGRGSGRD
ncbi:MAG: hypothetical protein JST42_10495 [Bacteroidetes bacterium]|nr:hypothetical protein [Bacteroidota bacterium]